MPRKKPHSEDEPAALTGYRLMWMMVIFDLPVGTKGERRGPEDLHLIARLAKLWESLKYREEEGS